MHMTEKGMQFVSPLTHQAREVNVNPLEITRAYQLLLCYYHNILFALISGLLPYLPSVFCLFIVYSTLLSVVMVIETQMPREYWNLEVSDRLNGKQIHP